MKPFCVIEAVLYAEDLDPIERFYTEVLGLQKLIRDFDRHIFFACGLTRLLIFNPHVTATHLTEVNHAIIPLHGARGPGHLALGIQTAELENWRRRLTDHSVAIESEVVWPQGGYSIYFRDPAGNSLELVTPAAWGLPEPKVGFCESADSA